MAALEKGSIFARRYRVVRFIATGGMGAVYEVAHLETERRHALKVVHPHVLASDELHERWRREARIAGRVESPYIVDVFDAGVDDATGMPFLVMELLRGEDLGERLRRVSRLPPAEVIAYLGQTALALDRTHRAHIVHRDLKPRNLFLAERDDGSLHIKVLDFGVAKIVAEGASMSATQIVGTPLYMAPEQLDGGALLTAAADIHALGMVAYTLLVGVPYFDVEARERGVLALAKVIARGPREPASARAAARGVTLPKAFDAWFARATAAAPAQRFPSAIEAARALAEALSGAVMPELAGAPPPTPSLPPLSATASARLARSSPRPYALAASALGLGLAIVGGFGYGVRSVRPACQTTEVACGGRCTDTSSDPRHCGACRHDCLGGACEAGACQPIVLASGQDKPTHLVTHGGRVYWINGGSGDHDGAVRSVPVSGGAITTLASDQSKPSGMATDGTYVYWVNYGDGAVTRVPIEGGEPEVLAKTGQHGPRSVAVSARGIYWTNRDEGTVMFRSTAGQISVLAAGRDQPGDLALDAEHVYWADRGGQRLMAMSLHGGEPRILGTRGPEVPIGIALGGSRVYWIEYAGGRVMSVPIRGGHPSVLATGQNHPLAVAVDAKRVYWTNQDEGTIMAMGLDGSGLTRLHSDQGWPESLALDATSIYWTNAKTGQVMRLAK